MKKILILILVISLQILNAKTTKIKDTNMSNILLNKPSFSLDIQKENTELFITLNGETIYISYDKDFDMYMYPCNLYITSGENILKVKLVSDKTEQDSLDKNAYANVSLKLTDTNGKEHIISQVIYKDGNITNSTKQALYNSNDNFKEDNEKGDVSIGETTLKIYDENRTTRLYKTYEVSQIISLQTPFPRWKFLDSDDIYDDGNFYNITMDNYYKLLKTPKIQELYKLQEYIFKQIQKKDIASIIDLFDERSNDLDIAFFREPGYSKKDLYDSLLEDASDETREMLPWNPKKKYFYVTEGSKTVEILKSIIFNNKAHDGSAEYKIHFRYQNGQWIITR